MWRRGLCVALSALMVFSGVPTVALAEAVDEMEETISAVEGDRKEGPDNAVNVMPDEAWMGEPGEGEDEILIGEEVVLEVQSIPTGDVEGPEVDLSSLSVSSKEATAGDSVEFSVDLSDPAGVKIAGVSMVNVGTGKTWDASMSTKDGRSFSCAMDVTDSTAPGDWRPYYVYAYDALSNCTMYYDLRQGYSPSADLSAWDFVVVPTGCHLVTYTDGCNGTLFADQRILVEDGDTTPAFDGDLTREGYFFDGWSPEVVATVTRDVTYTATWREDDRPIYTVTFTDGCGGTVFDDFVYQVREGEATPEPANSFWREGYDFAGFDPVPTSTVSSDVTYTAQWTPNANFVVALNEGPIHIQVSNYGISCVVNGVVWKTTNVGLGSVDGYSASVSPYGVTIGTTFYPQQEGFATLYAYDYNGTRLIGSCTVLVTAPKPDVAACEIELDKAEFTFSPKTVNAPKVTVRDGEKTLVEGIDYELLIDAFEVGDATVTVNGINDYTGVASRTYTIKPLDISTVAVPSIPVQAYDGTSLTPQFVLTCEGVQLELDRDYSLTYVDNDGPGVATAIAAGMGNYTGELEVHFAIVDFSHDGWTGLPGDKKGYTKGGSLVKGWLDLDKAKHYFGDDGAMLVGWNDVEVDGKVMHYYFHPSGNLARNTWATIDGKNYYFRPSGNMATGWATISDNGVDKKYYFLEDGTLVKGTWHDVVNDEGVTNHYYFRPSGSMATEWAEVDVKMYFFRPSGNMATGFADVPDDQFKRYFKDDGSMAVGWCTINGKRYYFRGSGAMQTGRADIDGVSHTFSDNGVLVG